MDKATRRKELMDMYCSQGMLLEDVFEMIISLEEKVEDLEFQLSEIHDCMQEGYKD